MKNLLGKIGFTALLAAVAITLVNPQTALAAKKSSKTFNVTFVYGTNVVTQQVRQGKSATVPTNTAIPGFTFVGWTDTAANIQSDKVILGAYTPVGGTVTTPTALQSKAKKINNNTSAAGEPWWDYSLKGVPGKTCVLRWYNGHNGELWKIEVVPYGTTLPDPADPCLDHYEFVGWEGSWENITEDRNIMASYYHLNKVTLLNFEGQVYDTIWVRDYMPCRKSGLSPRTEKCDQPFSGKFDVDLSCITHDVVAQAIPD